MRARADWAALLAASLLATTAGAAEPESPPALALKPIPHYATEAEARKNCPGDAVVWADPVTGFYYPKFLPAYGRGAQGGFTCLRAAKRADYWDANPFDEGPNDGRVFPIDPSLLGPGV